MKLHTFYFLFFNLFFALPYATIHTAENAQNDVKNFLEAIQKTFFYKWFSITSTSTYHKERMNYPNINPEIARQLYVELSPVNVFIAGRGAINLTHQILGIKKILDEGKRQNKAMTNQNFLSHQEKALDGNIKLLQYGGLSSEESKKIVKESKIIISEIHNSTIRTASLVESINGSSVYFQHGQIKTLSKMFGDLTYRTNTTELEISDLESTSNIAISLKKTVDYYELFLNELAELVFNENERNKLDRTECIYLTNIVIPDSLTRIKDFINYNLRVIKNNNVDEATLITSGINELEIKNRIKRYEGKKRKILEQLSRRLRHIDREELQSLDSYIYRYTPKFAKQLVHTFYTGPNAEKNTFLAVSTVGALSSAGAFLYWIFKKKASAV